MNVTGHQEVAIVFKQDGDTLARKHAGGTYIDENQDDTTDKIEGKLVTDSYDLDLSQEQSTHTGLGNAEPRARSKGSREYELSLSLEGEDKDFFDNTYNADSNLEFRLQGDEKEYTLKQGDWSNINISQSQDESMTTEITVTFLSFSSKSPPSHDDLDEVSN